MLKSISAWAFDPQRPAGEIFKIAKENGFAGVEVSIGAGGAPANQVWLDSTQDDCKRLLDEAAAADVQIVSLASGLGWANPLTNTATQEAAKNAVRSSLQVAKWLGTDTILVVPGGVGAEFIHGFRGAPYDQAYDNALAALKELKSIAEDLGVAIGVENVWNKFLLSPLEFRAFLDEIGSDFVGAYFDVGNVIVTGYPEQWIRILGKRIKRIHFKDFKRDVGNLSGFCDLLDGDVNFPAVMQSLRETGYSGPVTAEFFNCEADLPKISAAMDTILA
jgi:L-ribulose-5-phosphate 3-epimerase